MPRIRYRKPEDLHPVGTRLKALYPNEPWGTGTVIEVHLDPTVKPYVLRRDDGTIGYFHHELVGAA